MKVLITGGGGVIGLALTERLLASGYEVVVYDIKGDQVPAGARFVDGDVRDIDRVAAAGRGCDAGIHLAALAGDASAADIMSVNVLGAYAFLMAARRAEFRIAIVVGSAPVHLSASKEDDGILGPTKGSDHPYDLSKVLQEVIGRDFHSHGLPVVCLRPGHVVRGQEEMTLEGAVRLSEETYCRGGWVALEDVTKACAAALRLRPDPDTFETLNVVGARGARERFRVATTEARLGIKLEFDFAAYE
jgi:nucleoside-diphosphate-sugar epimerase